MVYVEGMGALVVGSQRQTTVQIVRIHTFLCTLSIGV
jgi:hypothetical protein